MGFVALHSTLPISRVTQECMGEEIKYLAFLTVLIQGTLKPPKYPKTAALKQRTEGCTDNERQLKTAKRLVTPLF